MEITREGIKKYLEDYGVEDGIKAFAELIDERVYVKVDEFKIIRKELKLPLVVAGYLKDDLEILTESLYNSVNPKERQHIKKIGRLSNLTVEKLSEKFSKLLFKEFGEHVLSYGKELLLRDKSEFYRVVGKHALLDSLSSRKTLLLSGFKKLDMSSDEVIFLLLSYFTKWRGEYSNYEKAQNFIESHKIALNCEMLKEVKNAMESWIKNCNRDTEIYNSKEFLNIVSYFKFLKDYEQEYFVDDCEKLKVFYSVLEGKIEEIEKLPCVTPQTKIELEILNKILFEL